MISAGGGFMGIIWAFSVVFLSSLSFSGFFNPGLGQDPLERTKEINADLDLFKKNPSDFMDRTILKLGPPTTAASLRVDAQDPISSWLEWKDSERLLIQGVEPGPEARDVRRSNDNPRVLTERQSFESNLYVLDEKKLLQAEVTTHPWSDDYWPIRKGILGARYAFSDFRRIDRYIDAKKYIFGDLSIQSATREDLIPEINSSSVQTLSPSEKYDLLVGDSKMSLTKAMWREGWSYYKSSGEVEKWMGICHGWAPAAYMLPRPRRAITMIGVDGTEIDFYPSDIKGLASLLWARGEMVQSNGRAADNLFIGGRCNTKNPAKDSNTGRVFDTECFDNNPSTWHLAVVNKIGIHDQSLILDATFDYEVWNQPIVKYQYSYFNPATQKAVDRIEDARVDLRKTTLNGESVLTFKGDTFGAFRKVRNYAQENQPLPTHVIGIVMDLTYTVETQPTHATIDHPGKDLTKTVRYYYDLEITENGDAVGGEWYSNKHPDFLWTPPLKTRAVSPFENLAQGEWDRDGALPKSWIKPAIQAAQSGLPLARIVETLIAESLAD